MTADTIDMFKVIERTKRIDPDAFLMNVDASGYPAGFVLNDDARREAAYQIACAELELDQQGLH